MQFIASIKADASPETPVVVRMQWSLREWRYARDQLKGGATDGYEYRMILRAVEDAVNVMDAHYNVEVKADE